MTPPSFFSPYSPFSMVLHFFSFLFSAVLVFPTRWNLWVEFLFWRTWREPDRLGCDTLGTDGIWIQPVRPLPVSPQREEIFLPRTLSLQKRLFYTFLIRQLFDTRLHVSCSWCLDTTEPSFFFSVTTHLLVDFRPLLWSDSTSAVARLLVLQFDFPETSRRRRTIRTYLDGYQQSSVFHISGVRLNIPGTCLT